MKIFTVDSFTSKAFAGNPAAVCLLKENKADDWLLNVAAEMNLSETAFLRQSDGEGYNLRWFTPKVEVELCGHATLASAHILWEQGILAENDTAVFYTQSGKLTARKHLGKIELDFPLIDHSPSEEIERVAKAIGVMPINLVETGYNFLAEVESEDIVRNIEPDLNLVSQLSSYGVIVTAKSQGGEFDFVSRYFVPAKGINEDPVTGSAHCSLASYWRKKLNKDNFVAYQASSRGGVLDLKVQGDRVLMSGNAVTILSGKLHI